MTVKQSEQGLVVVLAKGYPPTTGGVERYSEQVAEAYVSEGFRVVVLTQTAGRNGWTRRVLANGGSYAVWNAGPGPQPLTFVRMWAALGRLRRRDVVRAWHATTWRAGLAGVLALPRAASAVTVHGREVMNTAWPLSMAMRLVLARSDVVVTVSRATAAMAEREISPRVRSRARWIVSHNGVVPPVVTHVREARDGSPVRLLSLSRLVARKNVQGTLAALRILLDRGVEGFELDVAGTGPMRPALERAVDELGLSSHVRFLGYVSDEEVPALYSRCDVFVHPQTHVGEGRDFEGFGLVIADAMAYGCAVVVGDEGGPRELVDDGKDGFLVDGRSIESIADRIERLIADEGLRRTVGERARVTIVERFSWSRHVRPIVEHIDAATSAETNDEGAARSEASRG